MKLEHIALWTNNIEKTKQFYIQYFCGKSGDKFSINDSRFESYFIEFPHGSRLELMSMPSIPKNINDRYKQFLGFIHIAFDVGSPQIVDELIQRLVADGHELVEAPHATPDGYYEGTIFDPSGNRVEIAARL